MQKIKLMAYVVCLMAMVAGGGCKKKEKPQIVSGEFSVSKYNWIEDDGKYYYNKIVTDLSAPLVISGGVAITYIQDDNYNYVQLPFIFFSGSTSLAISAGFSTHEIAIMVHSTIPLLFPPNDTFYFKYIIIPPGQMDIIKDERIKNYDTAIQLLETKE